MGIEEILMGILIICSVMLFILLCIYSYTIYQKNRKKRAFNNINDYIQENDRDWYNYLVLNKPLGHHSNKKMELAAIDTILVSYITTMNKDEIREKASTYAVLNMKNYYVKQMMSRDESDRLHALQRTLIIELEFLVPLIERRLKENRTGSVKEYLLMLRVMAKYNRNLFLAHLYKPRLTFRNDEYHMLLANMDENYLEHFKDRFEELPIQLKLAYLESLCLKQNLNSAYLQLFECLLKSECAEIRLRALRAISSFGEISHIKHYENFVQSSLWEERLLLAEILRFVTEEKSYTYLQTLLQDSNSNVRKQAALSLMDLPDGKTILQQVSGSGEESPAATAAGNSAVI
ncbi:HEAT repeat domain-containing protein [Solibacillus sp. FSL W7-1464]|uniref:HEAT repeat domain-containing protein n=1 Tax=Solibacillus sp. FSL W7-1464 TaxID=2921706 RepID=UPI0030FBF7A9